MSLETARIHLSPPVRHPAQTGSRIYYPDSTANLPQNPNFLFKPIVHKRLSPTGQVSEKSTASLAWPI